MKNLPFLLIYFRLALAVVIPLIGWALVPHYRIWIIVLMFLGLLSDVLDGIVARRVGVSSEKLRVWDSNVDVLFWLTVMATVFWLNWSFVAKHWAWIGLVILLEALCYVVSIWKFKKTIATHSIMAKIWTITLFAFLVDLTINGSSTWMFWTCIVLGVISRIEIILIILRLKEWTTDVPSLKAVNQLNRGLPVKKSKWLNG